MMHGTTNIKLILIVLVIWMLWCTVGRNVDPSFSRFSQLFYDVPNLTDEGTKFIQSVGIF